MSCRAGVVRMKGGGACAVLVLSTLHGRNGGLLLTTDLSTVALDARASLAQRVGASAFLLTNTIRGMRGRALALSGFFHRHRR